MENFLKNFVKFWSFGWFSNICNERYFCEETSPKKMSKYFVKILSIVFLFCSQSVVSREEIRENQESFYEEGAEASVDHKNRDSGNKTRKLHNKKGNHTNKKVERWKKKQGKTRRHKGASRKNNDRTEALSSDAERSQHKKMYEHNRQNNKGGGTRSKQRYEEDSSELDGGHREIAEK